MILSSVIIVLAEVLEVALLLSLFLALSFRFGMARFWVIRAIAMGTGAAVFYAVFFDVVADWFDGGGQEVVNAVIQAGIYICLLIFNVLIFVQKRSRLVTETLKWVMIIGVCLSVTSEGSEIFLYISGFLSSESLITPVIIGSILGSGIGLSLGVLIYYLFIKMPGKSSLYAGYFLLLFVAAGMISQAVRLLIQVDWLPAQKIVWDVSDWIDESSMTGRLLFSLVGYEATPTPIEIQCYVAAILGILLATVITHYYSQKESVVN